MDNFLKTLNQVKYKDIQELLNKKMKINPTKEAILAFLLYFVFGFNWILWSDTILSFLVKDVETYKKIQITIYKSFPIQSKKCLF